MNVWGQKESDWPVHCGVAQRPLALRKEVGDANHADHPETEGSHLQRKRHQQPPARHAPESGIFPRNVASAQEPAPT